MYERCLNANHCVFCSNQDFCNGCTMCGNCGDKVDLLTVPEFKKYQDELLRERIKPYK